MQVRIITILLLGAVCAVGIKQFSALSLAQEAEEGGVMLPPVVVTPESKTDMNNGGQPTIEAMDSEEIPGPQGHMFDPLIDMLADADKDGARTKGPFKVSMGSFGISLMYSHYDMSNLTQILDLYERTMGEKPKKEVEREEITDDDPLAELLKEQPAEPKVVKEFPLPNFYLGTVMYQHAGEWSVWINQKRINAKHPTYDFGSAGSIRVTGITSNMVTLNWTPADMPQAVRAWISRDDIKVASLKHRQARGSSLGFDEKNKVFVVSMLNNQTFSANSMQIVEGKLPEVDTQKSYDAKITRPEGLEADDATLMLFEGPEQVDKLKIIEILKKNKQMLDSLAKQVGGTGIDTEEAPADGAADQSDTGTSSGGAASGTPTDDGVQGKTKGLMEIMVRDPGKSSDAGKTNKETTTKAKTATEGNVPPIPKPAPLNLPQPQFSTPPNPAAQTID